MPVPGVSVALVTLFDERLRVDASATADHAARLVEAGVTGVLVAGTTGEAAALDAEERMTLIGAVREAIPADVPVMAGTGAASAYQAVALTQQAVAAGADVVVALSPPRCLDVRPYYTAVAKAAGETPVFAYHFPKVSSPGVPVGALDGVPVDGIKDSSGDPNRLLEQVTAWAIPVYVGSSALLAFAGPLGAAGAILSAANLDPALCARAFAGDMDAQRELAPIHAATQRSIGEGVKLEMARIWGTSSSTRIH